MKLTKLFVGAFALSAMLVACGDDSASAKDTDRSEEVYSDLVVETFDDLPVCSDNRDGVTAYVKDEKTAYICTDGSWVPEEETSSSSIASTSSSSWQALSSSLRNDNSSSSSVLANSSSSVLVNEATQSSSSETTQSSSSEATQSSSSEAMQSSSSEATQSSSSEVMQSSSSETTQSSSSETTQSSSSADVNSSSSENELSSSSEMGIIYGTMTDSRDDKTYKTVKIGDQTWMAENLNYETRNSYCYDNNASNCTKYGRLYTWAAAKKACPEGWHLPSYDEWNTLFTAVGGKSTAGAKLKSQTGWAAYDGITNEDSFGFSALPAGNRYDNGSYYYEGYDAHFWSSTEYGSYDAYYMSLGYDYGDAYLDNNDKSNGHSVRCVKD